jgi:hypothetical protein
MCIKFVVKNVPPHNGRDNGEDLICSLSNKADDRVREVGHINDNMEISPCSNPIDSEGDYFQHRLYKMKPFAKAPPYIYMWVNYRQGFDTAKQLLLEETKFGEYPVYSYSVVPLMPKR